MFLRTNRIPERHRQMLAVAGLSIAALMPLWFYLLLNADDSFDLGSTFLIVLLAVVVHLGVVFAVSHADGELRSVMLVATAAKLAAASIYLYVALRVYSGAADSLHYFSQGQLYAHDVIWNRNWSMLEPFWSNNFIYMMSGTLQVVLGSSLQGITVIFALISFWGQYLCYRGFRTAAPQADTATGMLMIFLLPSLLYWPSCIGKDAVILVPIGMFVCGLAKIIKRPTLAACVLLGAGLGGILIVRPHVAAMFALALAVPWLASKNRTGVVGVAGRLVAAPLLLAGTIYLFSSAQEFLQMESVSQTAAVLRKVGKDNNSGGSAFNGTASLGAKVVAAPVLFFRPFPWEVRSVTSAIAALEGTGLLLLVWLRRGRIYAVIRRARENAFVLFVIVFLIEFSIVFSAAITNFGLLARERVMALPFFVMLCCFAASTTSARERAGFRGEFIPRPAR